MSEGSARVPGASISAALVPLHVAEAAERLRRDIREAIDMATVLDWITGAHRTAP